MDGEMALVKARIETEFRKGTPVDEAYRIVRDMITNQALAGSSELRAAVTLRAAEQPEVDVAAPPAKLV